MPEGTSIVLLREAASHFKGHAVRAVSGNSRIDLSPLQGRRVKAVRSWGKHFLLEFSRHTLRIHLMMFGSWRIDERKPGPARVSLVFDNGELNFYACSVRLIDQPLDDIYDWRDVMNALFPIKAKRSADLHATKIPCPDQLPCPVATLAAPRWWSTAVATARVIGTICASGTTPPAPRHVRVDGPGTPVIRAGGRCVPRSCASNLCVCIASARVGWGWPQSLTTPTATP